MPTLKCLVSLAVPLAFLLSSPAARADGITLTLANPLQTIAPGETVTFDATVTATPGNLKTIYLNGDTSSIADAGSIFELSDNGFLTSFPLSLTPTGSTDTYTGALFTVTNTSVSTFENYRGTFTLLGGANSGASRTLASVGFGSPAAVTPEPSSAMLFLTGLAGIYFLRRGKSFIAAK